MTVEEFANCLIRFVRQSIVPTLPDGIPRGAVSVALNVAASRTSFAQDLVNNFPALSKIGLVKDGAVDTDLAKVAIRGFFDGGNTLRIPTDMGSLVKLLTGDTSVLNARLNENDNYYELTGSDAESFCALLPATSPNA